MLISPIDFPQSYKHNNHIVEYGKLKEICQGGPEIGILTIDQRKIGDEYFGGPLLFHEDYIIVPRYTTSFISRGFKLCIIDINNSTLKDLTARKDLILPYYVSDNKILCFTDLGNKNTLSVEF